MIELCMDAAKIVMPDYEYKYIDSIGSGSTDMGDLSCVMPVVHPYAAGATGTTHGNNYQITGPIAACVTSAKFQMEMLYLLLKDNAERAKGIIEKFEPMFKAKEEYFAYIDSFNSDGDRITYKNDFAEINL